MKNKFLKVIIVGSLVEMLTLVGVQIAILLNMDKEKSGQEQTQVENSWFQTWDEGEGNWTFEIIHDGERILIKTLQCEYVIVWEGK